MDKGRVYWITGLPNSGKTTIGNYLFYELKKERENVVILDGDILKDIASGTPNAQYNYEDRLIRAQRYSRIAKLLSDQGIWVIVCAIAMFDKVRNWNRENISGYIEIYLEVPTSTLLYRSNNKLLKYEDYYEMPKDADIVLFNDDSNSIEESIKKIIHLNPREEDDYDRDREYWNRYYFERNLLSSNPSDFAKYVEKILPSNAHIMELGCGNGRDSIYFLEKGYSVTAVDSSDVAINNLRMRCRDNDNVLWVCDDFVKCKSLYQIKYDCIYSRFTLHAITEKQENELLENIIRSLTEKGIVCFETRTINDDLYGKGIQVDRNSYIYNNHFRRFIDAKDFKKKLENRGFEIIEFKESDGFSILGESNPVLLRCVCKKS